MNEREKYELMWAEPVYRTGDGGVPQIKKFKRFANLQPGEVVVDFGCGEGKTLKALSTAGVSVVLIDIADNCLAGDVPTKGFLRHDLSEPLHLQADVGFCADMMEHLPTEQVEKVLDNIFSIVNRCYFTVSTAPDGCGRLIGEKLHLTVEKYNWWLPKFSTHGEITLIRKMPMGFTIFVDANGSS